MSGASGRRASRVTARALGRREEIALTSPTSSLKRDEHEQDLDDAPELTTTSRSLASNGGGPARRQVEHGAGRARRKGA